MPFLWARPVAKVAPRGNSARRGGGDLSGAFELPQFRRPPRRLLSPTSPVMHLLRGSSLTAGLIALIFATLLMPPPIPNLRSEIFHCPASTPLSPRVSRGQSWGGFFLVVSALPSPEPIPMPAPMASPQDPPTPSAGAPPAGLGCFDSATFTSLAREAVAAKLPFFQLDNMTPDTCFQQCSKRPGVKLAGLSNGNTCLCSAADRPSSTNAPDSSCALACGGDRAQNCGGTGTATLFQLSATIDSPKQFVGSSIDDNTAAPAGTAVVTIGAVLGAFALVAIIGIAVRGRGNNEQPTNASRLGGRMVGGIGTAANVSTPVETLKPGSKTGTGGRMAPPALTTLSLARTRVGSDGVPTGSSSGPSVNSSASQVAARQAMTIQRRTPTGPRSRIGNSSALDSQVSSIPTQMPPQLPPLGNDLGRRGAGSDDNLMDLIPDGVPGRPGRPARPATSIILSSDDLATVPNGSLDLHEALEANREWADDTIKVDPAFFDRSMPDLSNPKVLWIGCSDAHVAPSTMCKMAPTEFFVHRNIANVCSASDLNLMGIVEYAVSHLKVEHIVVCGHYGCSGIDAAMRGESMGLLDPYFAPIKNLIATRQADMVRTGNDHEAQAETLVELNAQQSAIALARSSPVQKAWKLGKPLTLRAWAYAWQDGRIRDTMLSIDGPNQIPDGLG